MGKLLLSTICILTASAAIAETMHLSGPAITELVTGTIIEIDTPVGSKLSVRYSQDGQLGGLARELAGYLGSASDKGRWWISSDQLCHRWDRWFDAQEQCLRIRQAGKTLHWVRQDGTEGTASISTRIATEIPTPEKPPQSFVERPVTDIPRINPVVTREIRASIPIEKAEKLPDPSFGAPTMAQSGQPERSQKPVLAQSKQKAAQAELAKALAPPAGPTFRVAHVERSDVLNVRDGPSSEYSVVGSLLPETGDVRIIGECQSRWCPVAHQGIQGWVNRMHLIANDEAALPEPASRDVHTAHHDPADAPRTCLTREARALLEQIEAKFGAMKLVSTCRAGATIAGSGRPSRHASGNAVDFNAGNRKAAVIEWLVANHAAGGTMTYPDMDHVHVDIGHHFVSLAGERRHVREASRRDWSSDRMGLSGRRQE